LDRRGHAWNLIIATSRTSLQKEQVFSSGAAQQNIRLNTR
jgi:hypothetical protein